MMVSIPFPGMRIASRSYTDPPGQYWNTRHLCAPSTAMASNTHRFLCRNRAHTASSSASAFRMEAIATGDMPAVPCGGIRLDQNKNKNNDWEFGNWEFRE